MGFEIITHDARVMAMNHRRAGSEYTAVKITLKMMNERVGNGVDCAGSCDVAMCAVIAFVKPSMRPRAEYFSIKMRYRKCRGNIMTKDECTT